MPAFTSSTSSSLALLSIICLPAMPMFPLVVSSSCWKATRYSLIAFFSHSMQRFLFLTLQSKQICFPHLGHLACFSPKGFPQTSQYSALSFPITIVVLWFTVDELSTFDVFTLVLLVLVLVDVDMELVVVLMPPEILARGPIPITRPSCCSCCVGSCRTGDSRLSGCTGSSGCLAVSVAISAPQSGQNLSFSAIFAPHSGQNLSLLMVIFRFVLFNSILCHLLPFRHRLRTCLRG